MAKINCVREFMQANTGVGVLLLAHTDTVSSDLHNVPLALKRARAVRTALVEQGGVAHSRVFMAEFPEHSLPVVTNDERPEDRNRVVAFRFFELPR